MSFTLVAAIALTANSHMRKFSSQNRRLLFHQSRYSNFASTKHASNGWGDYILTIHAVLRRVGMLERLPISRNSVKTFVHNVHNGPKFPNKKKLGLG